MIHQAAADLVRTIGNALWRGIRTRIEEQARRLDGMRCDDENLANGPSFAPVGPRCPVSIALYGYRDRLYVGLDADGTAMPDLEAFRSGLVDAFEELSAALRTRRARRVRSQGRSRTGIET